MRLAIRTPGHCSFFGTVQASAVVAASKFTAPFAVFDGEVRIERGGVVLRLDRPSTTNPAYLGFFSQGSSKARIGLFDGSNNGLEIRDGTTGFNPSRFQFTTEGSSTKRGDLDIDGAYGTFSPTPPKPEADMSALDWLEWACTDARKPHKPYEGLPTAYNPAVQEEANTRQCACEDVVQEHHAMYRKDISRISIGTARWADKFMAALEVATDLDDLRARLGLAGGE